MLELPNVKAAPVVAEGVQQMSSVHKNNISRRVAKMYTYINLKIGDSTQTNVAALVYGKNNN